MAHSFRRPASDRHGNYRGASCRAGQSSTAAEFDPKRTLLAQDWVCAIWRSQRSDAANPAVIGWFGDAPQGEDFVGSCSRSYPHTSRLPGTRTWLA